MKEFSGWNHRVIEFHDEETGKAWRAIHAVFYGPDGETKAYIAEEATIATQTAQAMAETLDGMVKALAKPVLHVEGFSKRLRMADVGK